MAQQRPILLFAFANDEAYRLRLEVEERSLREALADADRRKEIEYKPIGQASLDDIYNTFNNFNDQIYLFHYGGHSNAEFLRLSGSHGRSDSLATLFGQQDHLKLVFLNGCSNQAQVEGLFAMGVPAVIATNAPVGDDQACKLAEQFYKALAGGKNIRQAFEAAVSYVQNEKPELDIRYRRIGREKRNGENFPWGLYAQDDSALDWHFGLVEQESNLEVLGSLREASSRRYEAFTGPAGRYQYLRIDETLLAGIEKKRHGEARELIEARIGTNRTPFENSLETLWHSEYPHALLVGAGGMGKTVSLIQLWERYLDGERADWPVPIFIPLNEFNNRPEKGFIKNYIKEHYGGEDIDRLLKDPLQVGKTYYPYLVLLLDGFNEVTTTSNELIMEINELRARDKYPGVQLILSSRVNMRQTYQWQQFHLLELQPLSDEQIETFLDQPLSNDSRLLELLRNPMMLSIYAAQSELPQRYLERDLLKETVTSIGEMLFNVEMIQRIKIETLHATNLPEQASQRFVLEHLLPSIGWQMQQVGLFFLEKKNNREGQLDMEKALGKARECLNDDFFDAFSFFNEHLEEERFEVKPRVLFEQVINQVCCRELTLLVAEDGNFRFLHQNFRDYFAARHVQNQIRLSIKKGKLSDVIRKAPLDFYVRQILGELEGEHSNKLEWNTYNNKWLWSKGGFFLDNNLTKLLDRCRAVFDLVSVGFTIWNVFTIWIEQRGELSGADLSRLNIQNFSFYSRRLSRPNLTAQIFKGILNKDCFFYTGHTNYLVSASFSPDGRRILTGSKDKTAKVWDIGSGECMLSLHHQSEVFETFYSPDGRKIITSSPREVKLWDAEDGHQIESLNSLWFDSRYLPYDPDRRLLSTTHSAQIKDAENGKVLLRLQGQVGSIKIASYSPDGERILTVPLDNTVRVCDAQSGQCLLSLEGHSSWVKNAFYNPNGLRILTDSFDKTIKVWDAQSGRCLFTIEYPYEYSDATYSPDGRQIMVYSMNKSVGVYDADSGGLLFNIESPLGLTGGASYSSNSQQILTVSWDKTAQVWDAKSGQCLLTLKDHSRKFSKAVFSPDGRQILTVSQNEIVKIWDAQSGQCFMILTFHGHSGAINCASFSPDKSLIITGSKDKTAKIWNFKSGQCLLTLKGHPYSVIMSSFSPDGRHVITGTDGSSNPKYSRKREVVLWDAKTGTRKFILAEYPKKILDAAFSPDGSRIVTGSGDNTAEVWDTESGQCLLTLKGHSQLIWSITFSPDGSRIVTGSKDNTAKVWDAESGQCLLTLRGHLAPVYSVQSNSVTSVAYSPDGARIITGSEDNTAKVWDAESGQCLLTLEGHSKSIWNTVYSPDGYRIVTRSTDNTTKVWDAKNGQCLQTLPNIPGLFIQGCDFRGSRLDAESSEEDIALLRQYGGIFNEEDARRWEGVMEKHFGIAGV